MQRERPITADELDRLGQVLPPRLEELEAIIERGLETFVEVGRALAEIRDSRLYRDHYTTFETYCKSRWGWKRAYAYQIIGAAEVSDRVSAIADNGPRTESQARPLTKLDPERQPEAWQRATDAAAAAGEPVRARHVEEAVAGIAGNTKPKKDPRIALLACARRDIRKVRKMTPRGYNASKLKGIDSHLATILNDIVVAEDRTAEPRCYTSGFTTHMLARPCPAPETAHELIGAGLRALARRHHPDAGGSHAEMIQVNGVAKWLRDRVGGAA